MDLNKIITNNKAEEVILNYLKNANNLYNFVEKCKDSDLKKLFNFLTEQARKNNINCADENTVFSWCDEYFINYEEREKKKEEEKKKIEEKIKVQEESKIKESEVKETEMLTLF